MNNELIAELTARGPAQFADWSQPAFDSFIEGPARQLAQQLQWRGADPQSLDNYLRLVYQGVGAGWLTIVQPEATARNFLQHSLENLVVYGLAEIKQPQRSAVLQTVWNLGEGLSRQPEWLNQFAIARTGWMVKLGSLADHLAATLAPVLSPLPASSWDGGLRLQTLNLRHHSEAFIPGRLYLASPVMLCIEDRSNPHETIGVLLQKADASEVIGLVGRLPVHEESFTSPDVVLAADEVRINNQTIATPRLSKVYQSLCLASGFVAICSEDSQRLWLVEAA